MTSLALAAWSSGIVSTSEQTGREIESGQGVCREVVKSTSLLTNIGNKGINKTSLSIKTISAFLYKYIRRHLDSI
jgi:hypothetical protein